MQGRTHLICGCLTGALLQQTGIEITATGFMLILIGSIVPDIDTHGLISTPGKFFPFFPRLVRDIIDSIGLFLHFLVSLFTRHRGLTHAACIPVLLIGLSIRYHNLNIFLLSLGVITHLFLDFLTEEGVPIVYPISSRKFSAKVTKTGSRLEEVLYWTFLFAFIYFGYTSLSNELKDSIKKILRITP